LSHLTIISVSRIRTKRIRYLGHEIMRNAQWGKAFYLLSDLSIEENLFFVIFELRLIFVWVPA
jgi:hypothetical protein